MVLAFLRAERTSARDWSSWVARLIDGRWYLPDDADIRDDEQNRASRLPGLPWARHVVMAPAQDPEYNRVKSDHSMLVVNVQSLAERLGIRFRPVAES